MALSGKGFLKRVVDKVRDYTDDTAIEVRFTDAAIVSFIRHAWADVVSDINRISTAKVRVRKTITLQEGVQEYALPPCIGKILSLGLPDETTNTEWAEKLPNHPLSPYGMGWAIEGHMLYFDPKPTEGGSWRLTYVPSGEAHPFEATAAAGCTTTLVKVKSVIDGRRDPRADCYLGYVLSKIDTNGDPIWHRNITAYDGTDLTLAPALASSLSEDDTFEVLPVYAYRFEHVIGLKVGKLCAGLTGDLERQRGINIEYQDAIRLARLDAANVESRIGQRMTTQVRGRTPRWRRFR